MCVCVYNSAIVFILCERHTYFAGFDFKLDDHYNVQHSCWPLDCSHANRHFDCHQILLCTKEKPAS